MFLDQTRIYVQSGKGGDGLSCFRREKYEPNGGPDGGNGGRGGDIILQVNEQYSTLLDMGNKRRFKADNGQPGRTQKRTGKSGESVTIFVPRGTIVKTTEGKILADLTTPGQQWTAARGGKGGRGNYNYASSINQTPDKATPGGPAEIFEFDLELKLMADIGLVGFPNAGKSSLINRISSARPKIADYPFTTLEPVLGIVQIRTERSLVVADIPGIIEGAAEGRGLGHQFLKHIERTSVLLFIIDAWEEEAFSRYQTLEKELRNFHPALADKPRIVALNKCDLPIDKAREDFSMAKIPVIEISAATGMGLKDLVKAMDEKVPVTSSSPHKEGSW